MYIMLFQRIWILLLFHNGLSDAVKVYGLLGSTVQLVCPQSGQDLTWTDMTERQVYSIGNRTSPNLKDDIRDRLSVTGNHNAGEFHLNISDLRQSDAKVYECSIGSFSAEQTLIVINAPSNVMIENKISTNNRLIGTEGQDMTIQCSAEGGMPTPNVKLYIPGLSTISGIQSVVYNIKPVDSSYDGKMINCTASNNPDTPVQRSDTAVIYLNLKPLQPTMNPNPVSTEETVPLVVNCTSHGSRPAGIFQWYIGHSRNNVTNNSSQKVQITSTDTYTVTSTLTVSVDRTYHNQKIECGISNAATSDAVITFKPMDIKYAPKITVQNTTLNKTTAREIMCILDGNPVNYIFDKWQHYSVRETFIRELEGVQTLKLRVESASQYQDTGKYICTANNGIKDKTGRLKQTGSGYVTSNAPPVFTQDNNASRIQYGEFRKTGKIFVNVYSIPKYSSIMWYHGNKQLTSSKYVVSDEEVTVQDKFHGKEVELDGYRVTLTINELTPDDFGNYKVRLYSGFPHVEYTVTLESAGAPQTPMNFTVDGSSESSITIKWIAGYNGGDTQTFYVEYRVQGSMSWIKSEVPTVDNIQESVSLMYTVSGLKDGTVYDVRMFAKNKYNQSLPTYTETIQTLKASPVSTGAIIGGVAGGLVAIIVIMVILVLFVFKRRTETCTTRKKLRSESDSEDIFKDNVLSDSLHPEEEGLKDNILYQSAGSSTALAEVKKKKPSTSDSGAQESVVYAEVNKKTQQKNVKVPKQKVKKGKPKKAGGINTKALNNNPDGEYANAGLAMTNVDAGEYSNSPHNVGMGNKNAQGLEYADISFAKEIPSKGKKPVIHGIEDRTVYSDIDHTKKAPPPPQESEYEETNIKHDRRK